MEAIPRRNLVPAALVASDLLVLAIALWLANRWVGAPFGRLDAQALVGLRPRLIDFLIVVGALTGWAALFARFGLYRERYLSFLRFRTYKLRDLVAAVTLGSLMFVGLAFATGLNHLSVRFILLFWALNLIGTAIAREALIAALKELRLHGRNLRHVLIAGSNERALELAERIRAQPELGFRLRGFVDNERTRFVDDGNAYGRRVAGFDELGRYLNDNVVDVVLIALPLATLYEEASRMVKVCEAHGVVVHFVPGMDFLNVGSSRLMFDSLDDRPVITVLPPTMGGWQMGVKRAIDIVGAGLLIVLMAPVFVAVAAAVKLTSPGPVLFVQERVGLFKRKIRVLKFRTMWDEADAMQATLDSRNEVSGPVFKMVNDPRLTPVGAFLRRTSLDELPQLFNVVRGDMSLVGPRPLPLRDYAGFEQDWHRRRFSVRPGITCLWQVSGRSALPFERWMELDMEYINNWSLGLDLKILLKTVPAVLLQRGAA